MLLLNAFSLNMLPAGVAGSVRVTPVGLDGARQLAAAGLDSAVGHADTAAVFADLLGAPVPCARRTVTLAAGQPALVGQYIGPRLVEGATELPEGARVEWVVVEWVPDGPAPA